MSHRTIAVISIIWMLFVCISTHLIVQYINTNNIDTTQSNQYFAK